MRVVLSLFLCFFLLKFPEVYSNSNGAPEAVCETMVPGHGPSPQTSKCPYEIKLSSTEVNGGDKVTISLIAPNGVPPFVGFLATPTLKSANYGGSLSINSGKLGSENDMSKLLSCKGVSNRAITHTSDAPKKTEEFTWTAPNEEGEYVILTTFVENYDTFWVKHPSSPIRVKKSAAAPAPEEPVKEEAEREIRASPAVIEKLKSFYSGCYETKGCFGFPKDCVNDENCQMFTSFTIEGEKHKFQIAGRLPDGTKNQGHVSSGLSFDAKMGEDLVTGCVYSDGTVSVKSYYNYGRDNSGFEEIYRGIDRSGGKSVGSYIDGYVFCEYTRIPLLQASKELDKDFDLSNDKYHMLLARSNIMATNDGTKREKLGFHFGANDKIAASESVHLTSLKQISVKSNILIELHGSVMIVAWIITSSLGIFSARYYKQTHTGFNPFNKALWFVIHIPCMILTVVLTVLGIIFIFVEIGGYSDAITTDAGKAHPILGLILTGLSLVQVLLGLMRPSPGTPKRPLFNWVHWTIGNTAHIIGIACIFLSMELTKSGLDKSKWFLGSIIAFVVFHVLMHGVLSLHTVWADKQMSGGGRNKLRGIVPGPMKPNTPEEAPGTGLRTMLLIIYIIGVSACAISLIACIAKTL